MNHPSKTKTVLFSTLNLLANSALVMSAHASGIETPTAKSKIPEQSAVNQLNSNQLEASFLKVYAGCKVDHASFEPVPVGIESVSDRILGIHAQLGQA